MSRYDKNDDWWDLVMEVETDTVESSTVPPTSTTDPPVSPSIKTYLTDYVIKWFNTTSESTDLSTEFQEPTPFYWYAGWFLLVTALLLYLGYRIVKLFLSTKALLISLLYDVLRGALGIQLGLSAMSFNALKTLVPDTSDDDDDHSDGDNNEPVVISVVPTSDVDGDRVASHDDKPDDPGDDDPGVYRSDPTSAGSPDIVMDLPTLSTAELGLSDLDDLSRRLHGLILDPDGAQRKPVTDEELANPFASPNSSASYKSVQCTFEDEVKATRSVSLPELPVTRLLAEDTRWDRAISDLGGTFDQMQLRDAEEHISMILRVNPNGHSSDTNIPMVRRSSSSDLRDLPTLIEPAAPTSFQYFDTAGLFANNNFLS